MLAMMSSRRKQPLSLRSSVRKPIPASIAVPGWPIAISSPLIRIVPEVAGRHAEQGLRDVAASRTDKAGETENLAFAQIEGDAVKLAFKTEITHRQNDIADRHRLLREHLGDFASDHLPDDVVAGDVGGGVLADEAAVAEHRHLVGDLEQLVHLVGDVDDALALGLERPDDLEQMLDFALGQRGRRLVHDENIGIVRDRLGDLDHLAIGDGKVADLRSPD